ncbi:MAG TPA: HEAT repeat domain-containing protein [Bacteroidales bacterium]|nr:HEAT repeat domain-containing protein [Bacteroidales bacterium]
MKDNQFELDVEIQTFPDDIRELVEKLVSDEGMTRMKARAKLVNTGPVCLPFMEKLLRSENRLLRWETAKVIEEIADVASIPLFIMLLEDYDDDIRWIASEGLIRVGKRSIRPVLEKLISNGDSFFLKVGAHHVLKSLSHDRERERLAPLLHALQNYGELGDVVQIEASRILEDLDNIINMQDHNENEDDNKSDG